MFLEKGALKICSKFIGEHTHADCDFNKVTISTVVLHLSVNSVMAFRLGSQLRLDILVPGDCKFFVRKSVNCICRKK